MRALVTRIRVCVLLSAVPLVVTLAAGLAASAESAPPPKKPDVYEVRQGGYVEKVDPSVDYKDRLPRIPPRSPDASVKAFHLLPGMQIDVVAAEPLVADPVDIAFDERGRLYVAEMIPYAEGGTSKFGSPNGRVSVLDDVDGDGRFDRSKVLVDRLVWPTGVACFDGGVFVTAAPDLLYCKDTDGDGKADIRDVVLTGFELSNPNALPNSLRWGLDNRIHGMTSTAGGQLRAVRWQAGAPDREDAAVQARGRDFSIDPRTGQLRLESGGAQFGMTFDVWGRKFESSNSTPCDMIMYDDRYLARNPYLVAPSPRVNIWRSGSAIFRTSPLEPWRIVRTEMRKGGVFSGPVEGGGKAAGYFTAACGVTIYKGDAWPEAYHGLGFVGEGAGNLVARMKFERAGIGFGAHRIDKDCDWLTSDEIWFRPIQFAHGPDGNLYLADMYREIFEHPDAVPPSAKKHLDLTAGNDRGRIYRISATQTSGVEETQESRRLPKSLTTKDLVALLNHSNWWHRNTAARLLYERQDPETIDPLRELAANSPSALARMHALYVLDGQNALTPDVVLARLNDEHPRVREHAVRLSEGILADAPAVRQRLCAMAGDPDLRVRYQLAFTLGDVGGAKSTAALAAIARRDAADKWVCLGVLSSSAGRAGQLVAIMNEDVPWRSTAAGRGLLGQLTEQVGRENRKDQLAEILRVLDGLGTTDTDQQLARQLVKSLSTGLKGTNSELLVRLGQTGDSRAGALLAEMFAEARTVATDSSQPAQRRAEAIRSLALTPAAETVGVLTKLLDSRQPPQVQTAALESLQRMKDPRIAPAVVAAWPRLSPQVRSQAAEVLFGRQERLGLLLEAVESGAIARSQLDPARVDMLLSHPDQEIRSRAAKAFAGNSLALRNEAVEAYRSVLAQQGDPTRGKAVFKKECSICHRLEGDGYDLGLPLQSVRNRGRETILLSVLDPNREVNPAYLNYVIVTDDGLSLTGMITSETATSITLKRAEGKSDTVLRNEIDELVNSGKSIMPEGLERQISKQNMADLIEYLMGVKY